MVVSAALLSSVTVLPKAERSAHLPHRKFQKEKLKAKSKTF
jgi:hypothetical protein